MEYRSPVHHGDRVLVSVRIEKVGRSSVHVCYEGAVAGKPVFSARNVAVAVDRQSFEPVPLPDWLRERLLAATE